MNMDDSIHARAAELFPDSGELQKGWLRAVAYLKERGLWIHEPGAPVPGWGLPQRHDNDSAC